MWSVESFTTTQPTTVGKHQIILIRVARPAAAFPEITETLVCSFLFPVENVVEKSAALEAFREACRDFLAQMDVE